MCLQIFLVCLEPTCTDGTRNRDETDVDCGGETCPKCIDSKVCSVPSDCTSGVCTSNICKGTSTVSYIQLSLVCSISAPTCSDVIRNRDETDVDCGGEKCPKCNETRTCNIGSDCVSGVCTSKICQGAVIVPYVRILVIIFCFQHQNAMTVFVTETKRMSIAVVRRAKNASIPKCAAPLLIA